MKTSIRPSEEQFISWIEKYVPDKDFFFVKKETLSIFETELIDVLLIPKAEFFTHATYSQIQLANSYEYWQISKEVDFVIVAEAGWITKIPKAKRDALLLSQVKMNRGLVFPLSYFSGDLLLQDADIVRENEKDMIVLYAKLWKRLSFSVKEQLLKMYSQQWDEWVSEPIPEDQPMLLQQYANTFPIKAGSNCFAATLFAFSQQEWIIHEWVHPQTFMIKVRRTHHLIEQEELLEGDIVIWESSEGTVQHASYHIGNELFFNKSGQTFFNPWKLITFSKLQAEWSPYVLKIYRLK